MLPQEYLGSNQEFEGWSFLFFQLNYTLILDREYPIRTDVAIKNLVKLKLTALNHSANSLFMYPKGIEALISFNYTLIPQRIERW